MAVDTPGLTFETELHTQPASDNNVHQHLINSALTAPGQSEKRAAVLPVQFAANGNDLTIVDESIAKSMRAAEALLSPEAKARVNAEAEMPYRFIKAAGEKHTISEITAHAGDSYWSLAREVVASRQHGAVKDTDIHSMVKVITALNGKSAVEANRLQIGEKVKIPRA